MAALDTLIAFFHDAKLDDDTVAMRAMPTDHPKEPQSEQDEFEQRINQEALVDAYCEFAEEDETLEEFDARYIHAGVRWGVDSDEEQDEPLDELL